jgi:hypothetical protein
LKYEFNGKLIDIPEDEIENLKVNLQLTNQQAIDTWLSDNGYEEDEEQENLEKIAKKVKIDHQINKKKPEKERKTVVRKVSDEKKALFNEISGFLKQVYGINTEILNENKLIQVKIGDKSFKINITETRNH